MICKCHLRCILHKPFLKHLLVDVLPIRLKHQFLFWYSFLRRELQYQLIPGIENRNSLFFATSFNSPNSIRNGCPVCHFRMFSLHARRSRGNLSTSIPLISFNKCLVNPKNIQDVFLFHKAISQSICVNSGCLSA
jgi:hypothetical protein